MSDTITVREITPTDAEWPTALYALGDDMPERLWVQGDLSILNAPTVGIVGARAATSYGGHIASELGYNLALAGTTVVSGGSYGIDALAHRGALAADGKTVVVMPGGVDVMYPRNHDRMFSRIAQEGGLLISAYPPGTMPRPHTMLERNRLIAALAVNGVVVVEASERSGALGTVTHAERLNRPVMAVPGPVTSALSNGPHALIRSGRAVLVTSTADVLEHGTPR